MEPTTGLGIVLLLLELLCAVRYMHKLKAEEEKSHEREGDRSM